MHFLNEPRHRRHVAILHTDPEHAFVRSGAPRDLLGIFQGGAERFLTENVEVGCPDVFQNTCMGEIGAGNDKGINLI